MISRFLVFLAKIKRVCVFKSLCTGDALLAMSQILPDVRMIIRCSDEIMAHVLLKFSGIIVRNHVRRTKKIVRNK